MIIQFTTGGIGDQLSKENFFVGVESVDDEGHKLIDLRLKDEFFPFHLGGGRHSTGRRLGLPPRCHSIQSGSKELA